jgi:RHS repeat-associated protein
MEKDNEIKGEGNSYDFGERMYDSRLGRWLKLDPKEAVTPGWTPYRFGLDNPIKYSDSEGEFEVDEATAGKYPNLKPALENLLNELKKPENDAKVDLLVKLGEFKNRDALFEVLTDGKGPKLKVDDIVDIETKKTSEFQLDPFGGPKKLIETTETITKLTDAGKALGIKRPAIAVTITDGKDKADGSGYEVTSETVTIDDALANSLSGLFTKKGNVNAVVAKIFKGVIIHEVAHVGDNRDNKLNSNVAAGKEVGEAAEKIVNEKVINPTELSDSEPKPEPKK